MKQRLMSTRMSSADFTSRNARIEAMKCHTEDRVNKQKEMDDEQLPDCCDCGRLHRYECRSRCARSHWLGDHGRRAFRFSAKLWLGDHVALDGAVGYAYLWDKAGVHMHGDLLLHTGSLLPSLVGLLAALMRRGRSRQACERCGQSEEVGLRVPFGRSMCSPSFRLVSSLNWLQPRLCTGVAFNGNGSLGVRYYFGHAVESRGENALLLMSGRGSAAILGKVRSNIGIARSCSNAERGRSKDTSGR